MGEGEEARNYHQLHRLSVIWKDVFAWKADRDQGMQDSILDARIGFENRRRPFHRVNWHRFNAGATRE